MFTDNAINEAINAAIASHSAHDLAEALADAGVSASRRGNYGADDEACDIDGYGKVFFEDLEQNPGWVVRAYTDDCDYPVDVDELADELAELVSAVQRIS